MLGQDSTADGHNVGNPSFVLALCSFGILALELALIRWMGGQIRIVAYFSNLILLAAFLGMGLGLALGPKYPNLIHWYLPALAVLSAILAFSGKLGLMHIRFPDPSISLWGAETITTLRTFFSATLLMVCFFWMVAVVFLLAAISVGFLFVALSPLKAYSANLLGSLLGVLAMAAVAAKGTSPPIWMVLGTLPFLSVSRRISSFVSVAVIICLAAISIQGAQFSPYNRIDLEPFSDNPAPALYPARDFMLSVNRDFHQYMEDLSDRAVADRPPGSQRRSMREAYDLPFELHPPGRALIVGAGTGNDVAAALRHNYKQVVAVDIDPTILKIGVLMHPERPYANPRVIRIVNDARAYFEQNPSERFDVVCYSFLDSHAMFSSMASLRLDNYVYTIQGIKAGWRLVKSDGILALSFSLSNNWMADRMFRMIQEATGVSPVVVPVNINYGATFLVGRHLDKQNIPTPKGKLFDLKDYHPDIPVPTDDWPFLYLRPHSIPFAYISVFLTILITAAFAVRKVYGSELFTSNFFDLPLFLMGAAFMLIESRMVTELSLLFGSTWVVNAVVFSGILLMILIANFYVIYKQPTRPDLWYIPLIMSLLLTWALGAGRLNSLSLFQRGITAAVIYALPIAFAGVIFSSLFKSSRHSAAALGSNLIGAVVGGILEYSSMAFGLRAITLFAVVLYLASLFFFRRKNLLAISLSQGN